MNVFFIISDSLRVDHLAFYAEERLRMGPYGDGINTPNLDALAADSTIFTNVYSEGMPTVPTRTSFLTGRFLLGVRHWMPLKEDDVVLPEILWDKGYKSALVTDVYHQHKPGYNLNRGYDESHFIRGQEYDPFVTDPSIQVDLEKHHKLRPQNELDRKRWSFMNWEENFIQYLRNISLWPDWWETDENHFVAQTVREAMSILDHWDQKDRIYMCIDCFDPHEPWAPSDPTVAPYLRHKDVKRIIDPIPGWSAGYLDDKELDNMKANYAGSVSMVDAWMGKFFDYLKKNGYYDNSLIIFTSDHGEPLNEHGIIRKALPWPYEYLSHIPLVIHHPGITGGRKVDAMVQSPDIMPTVLDALNIESDAPIQGKSLLPLMYGETSWDRDCVISGYALNSWSLRTKEWSYIHWLDDNIDKIYKTTDELYNREEDFYEQKDLYFQKPDVAKQMKEKLLEVMNKVNNGEKF